MAATVLPSDYRGDIILLSVSDLPPGPVVEIGETEPLEPGESVYTVGADVVLKTIRVYPAGSILLLPAEGYPLARLHHTAYSQPGNSGGALVSADGRLVGIVASGGEGRYEAVPATAIDALRARSGPGFEGENKRIGVAVRDCTLMLEDRRGTRVLLTEDEADRLQTTCMGTGNRQYFDLAAQSFGGSAMLARAFSTSKASLEQDPNALNARLTAAINFHLARWYEEEIPHLKFLMRHLPDDPQVIRLGIQAGVWGGDEALAAASFERLKSSNPNMVPAAEKFLANPPPRPARLPMPE